MADAEDVASANRPKSFRIALERHIHCDFKIATVRHGLTMHEVFEGFAQLVADGNHHALKIIEALVLMKMERIVKKKEQKETKKGNKKTRLSNKTFNLAEHDPAILYKLIEAGNASQTQQDNQQNEKVERRKKPRKRRKRRIPKWRG